MKKSTALLALALAAGQLPQTTPLYGQAVTTSASGVSDLRPEAKNVLDAIKKQLPNASPQKPIVVLLGESHDYPAQSLLGQIIIDKFSDDNKSTSFAVGLEQPHNFLTNVLDHLTHQGFTQKIPDPSLTLDTDGTKTAKIFAAIAENPLAPVTTTNGLLYLLENKIPVGFNDLAKKNLTVIDQNDPLTKAYVPPHLQGTEVDGVSPQGVAIRNRFIADKIFQAIKKTNAHVYFQVVGQNHILGNSARGFKYEESLAALLKSRGAIVVNVFNDAPPRPGEKPDPVLRSPLNIKIKPLPADRFVNIHNTPDLRAREAEFLDRLCKASGYTKNCFNALAQTGLNLDNIGTDLKQWLDEAQTIVRHGTPVVKLP